MSELPAPYLLTVPQACKLLGFKKSKVYQLAKENKIPVVRFGRYVRIPRKALEEWVDRLTAEGEGGEAL